jgi:hypothetical protein
MAGSVHLLTLLGAATAVTVAFVAALLTPWIRSRLYHPETRVGTAASAVARSGTSRTPQEETEDAAANKLLMAEHRAAIDLQNWTLASLMSVAASLTVAFLCTSLAATVLTEPHGFHLFAAALDLAAFGLVLWHFIRAARLRRAWIASRSIVEMLRQWSVVDRILVAGEHPEEGFGRMKQRVRQALASPDPDFATVVLRFGRLRLKEMGEAIGALHSVPAARFRYYLDRRPERQKRWFAGAEARVSGQGKRHRQTLMILFGMATAAALLKVALLLGDPAESQALSWTMLALLILIGLSGTLTSVFLNQNIRSLSHRYRSQSRDIAWWFERHAPLVAAAQGQEPLSGPLVGQLANAVVEFESLMLDELVDWIVITDHDSLEIAAA